MRKGWLRNIVWTVVGTLLALSAASCDSADVGVSHLAAKSPSTFPTQPSGTPTAPVTMPPFVTPSTVINTYPNPYDPGYANIDQLVRDSIYIALGRLEAPELATASNGNVVMAYPVSVQQSFDNAPETSLDVDQAEVTAANLIVGDTYIFFWGYDISPDDTVCIVGGVRGVMAYDVVTDTVTRLDDLSSSHIPPTQTLEQFESSVEAAQRLFAEQPIRNQPPVCSLSATGGIAGS